MKFYVKTTLDGHDLLKFQGIKVTQEEEPKASLIWTSSNTLTLQ